MELLNKDSEKLMVQSVYQILEKASSGMPVSDAVTKVAHDNNLTTTMLSRVIEAFNVASTKTFLKSATGDDRAGDFDLAIPDEIIQKIVNLDNTDHFVRKEASQRTPGIYVETRFFRSTGYAEPEKRASVEPLRPEYVMHKASKLLSKAIFDMDTSCKEAEHAKNTLFYNLKKAANYFRKAYRPTFDSIEAAVIKKHGELGKAAMDCIWSISDPYTDNEKRASDDSEGIWVDNDSPYTEITLVLDSIKKYAEANDNATRLGDEIAKGRDTILEYLEKEALTAGMTTALLTPAVLASRNLTNVVADRVPKPAVVKEKVDSMLYDQGISDQLASIKSMDTLANVIKDDDILRSAPIEKVIRAYTDIVSVSPNISQSTGALRSALRAATEYEMSQADIAGLLTNELNMDRTIAEADKMGIKPVGIPEEPEAPKTV